MTVELTAQLLRELLHYEPSTGVFTRLVATSGLYGCVGRVCGTPDKDGYSRISLMSRKYGAHRLAWLYTTGSWPKQQIDHINGNRSDNHISNLRDVTPRMNTENQTRSHLRSKVRLLGVSECKNKFRATIQVDGRRINLGVFESAEAAHAQYIKSKRVMHAGCTL